MPQETTIRTVLEAAIADLSGVSGSTRLDAELLLARAVDMPRSFLYAHADDTLDEDAIARFSANVRRRLAGEPMAYISGEKEFWSMSLAVSPATLVPRPDTELLVDQALRHLPRGTAANVLDLGTGCGAIALALARERPLANVTATDVSREALDVARLNAANLALPNVEFLHGDWCAPVRGRRFEIVVSNPPYIEERDPALADLAFEPRHALASGADGLDAIRRIAADVPEVMTVGGIFLVEHGASQRDAVAELLTASGFRDIESFADLAGHPRVTCGIRRG